MSAPSAPRYDMPAVFGPSPLAAEEAVPAFEAVVISFKSDRDAIARLLPRFFEPGDRATVAVSRMVYRQVGYLGLRGYEELVVGLDAVYDGPDGPIEGQYMPVLWVSDCAAITAGREYMGYAKIYGELPDLEAGSDTRSFTCSEFGSRLLAGRATALKPLEGEKLERVREATAVSRALGWKYIPAAGGGADADYPTLIVNRWNYQQAWTGAGEITLFQPDAKAAPFSSRIMAALAQLPVKEMRRAFAGRGSGIIDRGATRRLTPPAGISSGLPD